MLKKVILLSLCLSTCIGYSLTNIHAEESSSPKEEIVYVNLKGNGDVSNIDVVNVFENTSKITDYGDYNSVKSLNTTDTIHYDNGEIYMETNASKVYYQGNLKSLEIPWEIDLHYYLDGKEVTDDKLAGASGHLLIEMEISKNTNYQGNFFESFALQVVLSLDTELCKNIEASGATIANVGTEKQITYTLLPNSGGSLEIEADVDDFEYDGISINGVPLSLNINIDENLFMDQISTLQDAITQINSGAIQLSDGTQKLLNGSYTLNDGTNQLTSGIGSVYSGAGSLKSGANQLYTGVGDLSDGVNSLASGISSFQDGINLVQDGIDSLTSNSVALTEGSSEMLDGLQQIQDALNQASLDVSRLQELSDGLIQFQDGLNSLEDGAYQLDEATKYSYYYNLFSQNGLDIDTVRNGNDEALDKLTSISTKLDSFINYLKAFHIPTNLLSNISSELDNIELLLQGNNAIIDGTKTYFDTISPKVDELYEGTQQLNSSYSDLSGGVNDLIDGISDTYTQMNTLKEAIDTMTSKYGELDQGINEYTSGVQQLADGYQQLVDNYNLIVEGSQSLVIGSNTLYSGTSSLLTGVNQLYNGCASLYNGSGQLNEGVLSLIVNLEVLNNGTTSLASGTTQLNNETENMDTTISESISSILDSLTGNDIETGSFVSSKNTSVEDVQFVIKTDGVKKEEQESKSTKEEHLNFFEKILKLFNLK